jgi:hypothetical protein
VAISLRRQTVSELRLEAELPSLPFRCCQNEGEHDGGDEEHLAPEDFGRVRDNERSAVARFEDAMHNLCTV